MQEHARTRKRLAALAAFAAFWAALLVTIGFPVALVGVGYLALVLGLAIPLEGRRLRALGPWARETGRKVARGADGVAGRARTVDLAPVRAAGVRGASLTRRGATWAAAASRTGASIAATRARRLRHELTDARERRGARAEAVRLNARAAALRQEGELEEALAAGEQALDLVRGLRDRRAEALTLNGIGLTHARLGDEAAAVDAYETAVAILTELGDGHGAGRVLANLGALHLDLGHADEARARWTDALERLEPGSPEHERTAEQLRLAG